MKDLFNGAAILSLALLIFVLVTMGDNIVLTMVLLVVAVVTSSITTSWSRFATFLARKSTLGLMGENNQHHIVVTEDKLVEEGPTTAWWSTPSPSSSTPVRATRQPLSTLAASAVSTFPALP